jgi:hypothetical protein
MLIAKPVFIFVNLKSERWLMLAGSGWWPLPI